MTVAGQTEIDYAYDNANRLLSITQGSLAFTVVTCASVSAQTAPQAHLTLDSFEFEIKYGAGLYS